MIGDLDVRAVLEAPLRQPDGAGGFVAGWTEIAELWIGLAPLGGADTPGPDRLESRTRYRVTLRRRAGVRAGMRLVTAARTLTIQDVQDAGPRAPWLTLICEDAP